MPHNVPPLSAECLNFMFNRHRWVGMTKTLQECFKVYIECQCKSNLMYFISFFQGAMEKDGVLLHHRYMDLNRSSTCSTFTA